MRLAVIGASGRTGGEVVRQALSRTFDVLALARHPQSLRLGDPGAAAPDVGQLSLREADVLDVEGLVAALAQADAVVSALGIGASRRPTEIYSVGTANVLTAMSVTGVGRLVVVSATPAGPREEQPALQRRVAMPILERLFGATYADMRRMEAVLRDNAVSWTALRPPRLLDKPALGHYRVDRRPLPRGGSITIPDLATALLDSVPRADMHQQALYVAN